MRTICKAGMLSKNIEQPPLTGGVMSDGRVDEWVNPEAGNTRIFVSACMHLNPDLYLFPAEISWIL